MSHMGGVPSWSGMPPQSGHAFVPADDMRYTGDEAQQRPDEESTSQFGFSYPEPSPTIQAYYGQHGPEGFPLYNSGGYSTQGLQPWRLQRDQAADSSSNMMAGGNDWDVPGSTPGAPQQDWGEAPLVDVQVTSEGETKKENRDVGRMYRARKREEAQRTEALNEKLIASNNVYKDQVNILNNMLSERDRYISELEDFLQAHRDVLLVSGAKLPYRSFEISGPGSPP